MKILALAGGVGGAKLADGLSRLLEPEQLTVVVNTGDDFEHLGLRISPDVDTVCYTLAGLANPETGWGRANETLTVMEGLRQLGAPGWFLLGDKDLATHLERTRALRQGESLSQVTKRFCTAWGVKHTILPMSDDPVSTIIDTIEHGELAFQEYFVHLHCEPRVKGFRFQGIEDARPSPGLSQAMLAADAIILCPSNPWVSIDPILMILRNHSLLPENKPIVAISPIVGGKAIKGPAAKMFSEMGIEPSTWSVAEHYGSLLKGYVIDLEDEKSQGRERQHEFKVLVTNTIMKSLHERRCLAQDVLNFIQTL